MDLSTRLLTTGLLVALAAGGPTVLVPVCAVALLLTARAALHQGWGVAATRRT